MKPLTLPGIDECARAHTTADSPPLRALADDTTADLDQPQMMSGPVQGRFLQMLVWAMRPRLVVEVGTFSGYAALSMAEALPPGGRIISCEVDERHAAFAQAHLDAAPHGERVTIAVGPAIETLRSLTDPLDLVFIDADKESYLNYYEASLAKLAPHGLIAVDNTLWNGDVLDPDTSDAETRALRAFNDTVVNDRRVSCVLTTIRDGLTLIRRV
jgi:caffeoyl-CoA O-methyltransferase